MGYTHYYSLNKEVTKTKWNKFLKDVKTLRKHLPKHSESSGGCCSDYPLILNGCMLSKFAVFNEEQIVFNGGDFPAKKRVKDSDGYFPTEDLSHETFVLEKMGSKKFCKTARKPYDLMVQSCLLLAKYHFGNDFEFSSDGNYEEWQVAHKFVSKYFSKVENVPRNF